MIINRKIIRTMLESKSQYMGSLVLIILSCLFFTMFNLLADNLEYILTKFETKYVQEDANFMTDQKINDISALESKYNMLIEEGTTIDYPVMKDKVLRIFSDNVKVNLPAIIKGNSLSSGHILLDPAFAKANNLKIGDSIKIYDKNYLVSGYMSLPNYIYPLKSEGDILSDPNTFGVAVISKEDFNSFETGNRFYTVKFNEDGTDINKRITEFKAEIVGQNMNILSWMNSSVNPRITYVSAKLNGINQVNGVLPVAILLLTCILTGIVMWRMVKRESPIIGTLYALGYKKQEILNHYIKYPIIIAFIGGIIGTILGVLALKPMLNLMISYFNMPVGIIDYNIRYFIISILLPIFFLGVSGYLVVDKALKCSPLELMKGGKDNKKVNFVERYVILDRFKFTTKFKIREQLRSVARSSFLLFGVILATMMLLLGFASKSSLDCLMRDQFAEAFQYNYSYVFNTIQQGVPEKGEAFSEIPFVLSSNDKVSITVYGINPGTQFVIFKDKLGNNLSTDQIIMTKALADKLKVSSKDTIAVTNKLTSKNYKITIDNIAESYVGNYIYIPEDKFNELFGLSSGSYMGIWSNEKLDIPDSSLLTIVTKDDIKNAFAAMTQPIQVIVGTMSFLSFLIGLIVIYVVTSLIIEENKENISLMKVLGYRKKEVYSMILNSSSFLVVIGYLLGIPILITSLGSMYRSITKNMSFSLPITISYQFLIVGFIIVYLTYEISKALSKKKINRISMNEVLKSRLE